MAVTSIWPIKGRIDQVINYARNPEKTTETYHNKQAILHSIDGVVHYAANDMKTEKRCYVTGINCREDLAAKQFVETKDYWSHVSGKDKYAGRVCFHGYQSFEKGEVNAETAHEIGVKLAEKLWGDRFEVIVATHCNTDHYHNHFVINSVSWRDGYKFDNRRSDYLDMKRESDRLCMQYKLSVVEDPAGRGRNYREYLAEQNGKPTNRSLIRQDIDRAIAASLTDKEFFEALEQMGYSVKLIGERGKPLKYPALKPDGAKGYFRFHKLGEGYSLEEIEKRIISNMKRTYPFTEAESEMKQYRQQHAPPIKKKGLQALYIRYCFELHIISRFSTSVKRVSFFMREDLTKLDQLDRQSRFLEENSIDTLDDIVKYREDANEKLTTFDAERKHLRNELKKAERAADEGKASDIREKIKGISADMKDLRDGLKLCRRIESRSRQMEEELQKMAEGPEKEKEVTKDELFGRSGRSGREDSARRN
ncbi:MAG: relaxase/mobilization nuclease domain-containing protein [Oscillospiraceae bacterium]|nr:relaxase/mobilization nuclease domain-containing protein [Oscillospiraceae bacterium]